MSRCKQCNIEILEPTERCPLCNSVLEKSEDLEAMYPQIHQKARAFTMILRVYSFLAITIELILFTLAFFAKISYLTVLIPALFLFYIYMVLRFAVIGKSGHRAKIIVLAFLAVAIMVALDYIRGFNGWSINYVFPSAVIAVDVGILLLIFINKRNWQSYVMPELFMILVSLAGILLRALDIITHPLAIIIALDFSVLLFLGTIIIGGLRARMELKRRFHIK